MQAVAIIEPDPRRSASLQAALEPAGFRTEWFPTPTAAASAVRVGSFVLAIIGLNLNDRDPYALCRELGLQLPVITVADQCTVDTCVSALENGADDCVVRSISGRELVARVRSVLRRKESPSEQATHDVSVSLSEMRVRVGHAAHNLTRGETELLAVLLERAPKPTPITQLTQLLDARRGTIEARIKSVRKKIGASRLVSRGSLGYELLLRD